MSNDSLAMSERPLKFIFFFDKEELISDEIMTAIDAAFSHLIKSVVFSRAKNSFQCEVQLFQFQRGRNWPLKRIHTKSLTRSLSLSSLLSKDFRWLVLNDNFTTNQLFEDSKEKEVVPIIIATASFCGTFFEEIAIILSEVDKRNIRPRIVFYKNQDVAKTLKRLDIRTLATHAIVESSRDLPDVLFTECMDCVADFEHRLNTKYALLQEEQALRSDSSTGSDKVTAVPPLPPVVAHASSNWEMYGTSVTGFNHEASNTENQDAIDYKPQDAQSVPLIMCLSDGHGSSECFRSHYGSQLAVQIGSEIRDFILKGKHNLPDDDAWQRYASEVLPDRIVSRWQGKVLDHLWENKLSDSEIEKINLLGHEKRRRIQISPYEMYGATLLIVVITEHFLLCMQIGDGDILTVSDDGYIVRPVPLNEPYEGEGTDSLCQSDAPKRFRVHFSQLKDTSPRLILLSTDGCSKSYTEGDPGYFKFATDLLAHIQTRGTQYVKENLGPWLQNITKNGAGDDTTVGFIYSHPLTTAAITHNVTNSDNIS